MSDSLTGGYQRGSLQYECSAEPRFTGNCHCRDCQRATGDAYVPAFAVPIEAVKATGEVSIMKVGQVAAALQPGMLPQVRRQDLRQNFRISAVHSDHRGQSRRAESIHAGKDFFTASAQPWDHMDPALPKFPKQPKV